LNFSNELSLCTVLQFYTLRSCRRFSCKVTAVSLHYNIRYQFFFDNVHQCEGADSCIRTPHGTGSTWTGSRSGSLGRIPYAQSLCLITAATSRSCSQTRLIDR
jgi:hypothetical protein